MSAIVKTSKRPMRPTVTDESSLIPSYSVKYLGIVDGAIGVLSRKMALQSATKDEAKSVSEVVQKNQKLSQPPLPKSAYNTHRLNERRVSYNSSQQQW